MDYNKDETIRAKELAEKKLAEMGVVGAKRFALKAQNLYPELDGLPQLLATLDVYISAYKKINGEVNWYRVLAVQPFADEDTIRKHYRKMALVLHPDKNKSVGADGAFKILSQAWNFLSDKAKIIAYNQKRNLRGSYTNVSHGKSSSSATTSPNGFHKFPDENISNTSGWNGATYSTPAPSTMRNDTFWTTCNSSTKFRQSHNAGHARFSGISTKITQKGGFPRSGSNINVSSSAFFTNEATGVTHSAGETLKSAHNKSQTDITRGKNLQMKCHPSQKTDAGLVTESSASISSFAAKI
ncbi:dnaJ homolog subfamily B member 6-A-like [Hibiscus syriacus]|uniref:dnaJ homolog subfamily B member 6-A-like n=1 Tax=Hibiscus syriacus TaxID=106335 RepID=UPI001923DC3A|nr:dnaJ homolog subfamily B member 6-A-like [Hibiscus syriacus]